MLWKPIRAGVDFILGRAALDLTSVKLKIEFGSFVTLEFSKLFLLSIYLDISNKVNSVVLKVIHIEAYKFRLNHSQLLSSTQFLC